MPSVRWKLLLTVITLISLQRIQHAASTKLESISMTEDGWRPIIGSHREPSYDDEITHYRNPANKKSEAVKAEKPLKMPSKSYETSPQLQATTINNLSASLGLGSKIPPHSKPMVMMHPHAMHGPQIPLGQLMHRPIKYGHIMKMHPHKRHKPVRMQIPAYSTRDEIFVPAPSSNIGPYTFYSSGQNPLKTRIAQQQQSHIDYSNHFGLHNNQDDLYQVLRSPVQQYVLPKHPIQNDVHYSFHQSPEDYTRNLVPPPYKFVQEKEKQKVIKFKDTVESDQLGANPPNGVIVQVAPPFQFNQGQKEQTVDVEVTKEKLKVYHNTVPPYSQPEYDYHTIKTPSQKIVTYEVTEGKHWHDTQPYTFHYSTRNPSRTRRPPPVFTEESKPFLPTPVRPDSVPPTVPTDSEISTIYNQIAQLNRQRTTPSFFDIKEVSTHYPIVRERPEYQEYPTHISLVKNEQKESLEYNEVTTRNSEERSTQGYEVPEVETTTTPKPQVPTRPRERKRPNQRRRRPTQKTTTTEEAEPATDYYDVQKTESSVEETTAHPQRSRRPTRYRSTTPIPFDEEYTTRSRHRRPRPTTTEEITESVEVPSNHKTTYVDPTSESYVSEEEKFSIKPTTEKDFPANFESHFTGGFHKTGSQESVEDYEQPTKQFMKPYDGAEYDRPNRYYNSPPSRDEKKQEDYSEDYGKKPETTIKSVEFEVFNANTPENEVDYSTKQYVSSTVPATTRTETTLPEIITTTTTTTPQPTTTELTTTSTTTEASTSKSHRIRTRPVKYDNSNRPRFSVKEYRQRLSTTSTTQEPSRPSSSYPESMRNRFPHRSRRPITTINHPENEEDSTEPLRNKFVPKDARHNIETGATTDKPVKSNTRLRPFGRFKTTTEPSSTTIRVSIKPNIFSNLRRPTPISLKTRILNKQRSTTPKAVELSEDDSLEETNETDMSEIVESTIPYSVDATTEFGAKMTVDVENTSKKSENEPDILKNEDFMQSQIVSDLTSSAKNEYNKPGLFKNVSPTSRKVPSYFTLATEDPILPIEAFFPNLKDKQ